MTTGPLSHLSVLDFTRLLPGGYCTLLLADLGADVLKVEEPGRGDYIRWMPPFAGDISSAHLALNRGKRSMTLNLKHRHGAEVVRRLARAADVVVESFRPGVMQRLGVGYEALRQENERLVYCAITGYGQSGPYRDRAGHDVNYIGVAGLLELNGERGGRPAIPPVQIGDLGGGALMAAVGILAALAERDRTGRGRFVDVSMLDGVVSWLSIHAASFLVGGEMPERGAMRLSGGMACYRVYRCGDGRFLAIGALEPQFWAALCTALGLTDLIDRQFAPDEQDRLAARIEETLATRSRDEWVRDLAGLDACVGPVNDIAEAFEDPQVVARAMVRTVETAAGPVRTVGNPIRVTDRPDEPPDGSVPLAPPPGFGRHTDEALSGAGYSLEEIAALRADGVV